MQWVVVFAMALMCSCGVLVAAESAPVKNPRPEVMTGDLPVIQCAVCEEVSAALVRAVDLFAQHKAPLPVREYEIIEIIENVCKPTNSTGHWIREIDIVPQKIADKGTTLVFTHPGGISKCNSECLTIAKSCQLLLDDIDPDELSVYLYKQVHNLNRDALTSRLCKKLSSRCSEKNKSKVLPAKYKRREIAFMPVTEKDIQMEELVARMNAMGMKGSLKEREEIDSLLEKYSSTEDIYDDDEDEF